MAVRTISTRLTLDGEKQWKKEMEDINSALKTQSSDLKAVASEFRNNANSIEALTAKNEILNRQQKQAEEKVRVLEVALKDAEKAFGENTKKTDEYQRKLNAARVDLNRLNDELDDNERYLDEARTSADKCARSIDEYGKEVRDADDAASDFGGGIDGMIGKLGSLKGALLGGAAVGVVKEIAGSIMELEESTREYRSIMGTLEVSSQNAGYTSEETAATFQQLQNVLGDTQSAATATANLQAIGLEQEKLTQLTDAAIGAWATYGDSIPIDGLAEAINETIQVGKVTGTFADVLNWAGISEDEFNEKLASSATSAERADLVLQMMASQGLMDAAEGWRTVNEDVVAANESQRKLDEAWGKMGEAVAPVANALRNVLGGALTFAAGLIEDIVTLITNATQALRGWNDEMVEKTGVGMGGMGVAGQFSVATTAVDGSHAGGLDYVPYDGYIAELHRGERILTAEEASSGVLTEEGFGQMMAQVINAVEGGTGPQEVVLHVTTTLGGATVDEQIYRCNLRAQERHGGALVK